MGNLKWCFSTRFVNGLNSQVGNIGGSYRVCPLWRNIFRFWWIRHPRGTVVGRGRRGDKILWVASPGGWDRVDSCYWVSCGKETLWHSGINLKCFILPKHTFTYKVVLVIFWNAKPSYFLTWIVWHRLFCSDGWKCCSRGVPIWVELTLTPQFSDRCFCAPSLRPQVWRGTMMCRNEKRDDERLLQIYTTRWQTHHMWKSECLVNILATAQCTKLI